MDNIPDTIFKDLALIALYGYNIERRFLELAASNSEETIRYGLENGIFALNNGEIVFKDPFLRDEVVSRIPRATKKELHRKIAIILRDNFDDHNVEKMLSYHFRECGDYELALHYTLKWVEKLKEMHANEAALEALQDAQKISQKLDNKAEFRILLELIDLNSLLGRREEEKRYIEQLEQGIEDKEGVEYAEFIIRKGRYLELVSRFDEAIELYSEYVDRFQNPDVLQRLALVYYEKGNISKAIEILNEVLERISEVSEPQKVAKVYQHLGLAYWKKGEKQRALEYCNRALKLYRRVGDGVSETRVISNMGNVYFYQSLYKEALDSYEQALQVANEIGDVVFKARML